MRIRVGSMGAYAFLATVGASFSASSVAAESAPESAQLEEIVVTAQRRAEPLQHAAMAVSAVSGAAIETINTTQPDALSQLVPGIHIAQQAGSFSLFYLRGVGSFGGNSLSDSATAFNYDGVYVSRQSSTYGMYFDLDRMEVLKGPQGTLYGRNATGGAINIIPRKPVPGELGGDFSVDVGNYRAVALSGAINLPTGERGAVRISGQTTDHDGYENDGTSDAKGQAVRVQWLQQLNDLLTVRVAGDYFHNGGQGPGAVVRFTNGQYLGNDARIGLESAQAVAFFQSLPAFARPLIVAPAKLDSTYWGVNAEIEYQTGVGTLTFIPAYRKSDTDFVTNAPGFTIAQVETSGQTSAEVRLASQTDQTVSYVVGGYYLHEQINTNQLLYSQSPIGVRDIYDPSLDSYAAFGQLTFHATDQLRLVGGARFTNDRKAATISLDNPPPAADSLIPDKKSFSELTWRAAVEFDLTPSNLLYTSVETGFKAGGFSLSSTIPRYAPEKIRAYTLGSKNMLLDGRLRLNAEAFWWDYHDQQYSFLGAAIFPGIVIPTFATQNVGNATIKGTELETQFLATELTLLSADLQYLDAKYDTFRILAPQLGPQPPNVGSMCTIGVASPGLNFADCSGARLPFSSEWTLNLSAQQTVPLRKSASIVARVDGHYESAMYAGTEFLPAELQKGVWTADASLTLNFPGNRIGLTAYVRNITDADVLSQSFAPFASRAYVAGTVRPPRTFGLRLSGRF